MEKELYRKLKDFCTGIGLDIFGVADIAGMKKDIAVSPPVLEPLSRAVCAGARLSEEILDDLGDHPSRPYFHHYKTVNAFLDQAAYRIGTYIQREGYRALPVAASQIIDWEKQTALLSHKKAGVLAGLGWIGRNNLLVNPRLGAQFRLVTVLTDMPLEAGVPLETGCGSCRRCLDRCPAQAIKEKPGDFDHKKCFEQLKEFQKKRYVEQFVCGLCVKACKGKETGR